ncbi:Ig-like domain-containing protein [Deinococcus sp. JMULE3]|uniref:Ig-like domain-containing protein n=1 Tax=Deinococcus sp. JMULE3 TaxID=2518341 RepID=UPI0015761123|nr:Ig-like domain-containing protein [Deinococcus sp. JMULE3]
MRILVPALLAVLATSCGAANTPAAPTPATTQTTAPALDTQSPSVTMVVFPKTLRAQGTVNFQLGTRDNTAVDRVVLTIDGKTFVDDPTAYNSYAQYFDAAANGEHTVTVRVYDRAQNVTEQTQTFTVQIGP